ncbi:MAG: glycosyltransferase [Thermoanaerobacteraceae bacterium]|nr:glycosyltransferase [Thermoanaerobacteraceae bacterium]
MPENRFGGGAGLASVIIIARDEHPYLEQTVRFMNAVPAGYPMEIVVVDDGSRDGCARFLSCARMPRCRIKLLSTEGLGPARARNRGARVAAGEILVFCDAHIIVPPGWLASLAAPLAAGQAGAVCPALVHTADPARPIYGGTLNSRLSWTGLTRPGAVFPAGMVGLPSGPCDTRSTPSPVPLAPAGCLAVRRDAFYGVGGFEEELAAWGYDDVEFSLKLWLFGHPVAVVPGVKVAHISRPPRPYQRWGEDLTANLLLTAALHFSDHRLARLAGLAGSYPGFARAWSRVWREPVWKKRQEYFRRRVYDDDWFMAAFGVPF